MDISKNLVVLIVIGQILLIFGFIADLFFFHILETNGLLTVEGIFLALVIILLFIKSYIKTDESYFNGKKENQRKYN